MKFSTADAVEQVVWTMKLQDLPRATNRTAINSLANGFPPYNDNEQEAENIETNVNFLPLTVASHNARRQFQNAFMGKSHLFTVTVDRGPLYKRDTWGRIITQEINRIIRRNLVYYEVLRSTFANVVLHGIAPTKWDDSQRWCPDALSVGDVLLPSNTKLTMENLQYFAVWRSYTPAELWRMTHGPKVDPGWNMTMVNDVIKTADEQIQKQISYSETWSPELIGERYKQDLGLYASDDVPTIDCWDFYFWHDDNKRAGWNRRIVLDWPADGVKPDAYKPESNGFLFDPGTRRYSDKLANLIHFQFADASAVAPFRYHAVRSLGFLLYSVCHLQNRLICKLSDAAFEALMWYFRVANPEDRDRLQKIDLQSYGIIPEGLEFIKGQDRYKPDFGFASGTLGMFRQFVADASASYTQDFEKMSDQTGQTATEVMARVNSTNALVASMLDQAYNYAEFQYTELGRRFCIANSRDPDVRKFRAACFRQGVPPEALDVDCWQIEANRVLGAGNKILQSAQADKLMAARSLFDPTAQREVLHIYTSANVDDPNLPDRLVPLEVQKTSDATHDAQLAAGSLLAGIPMNLKEGVNHIDYVEALLASMAARISVIEGNGGMATSQEINGLINLAGVGPDGKPVPPVPNNGIQSHLQILGQDPAEKQRVKEYGDDLGQMMNLVKAYIQRLQEAQQQPQGGNGGMDPQEAAKAQAMVIQAQTKAKLAQQSHAQKTAQRQVQWQMEQQRRSEEHRMKMAQEMNRLKMDTVSADMTTAAEINRGNAKSRMESEDES